MKRTLLFVVLMCLGTVAMAQDSLSYKHSFRLMIHAAFPTGEFNNTAFEDDYPDFARVGTLVSASYLRQLKPFLSAGATVQYRTNKYNLDKFARDSDWLILEKESDPWKSWFTMADVYLHTYNASRGIFFVRGSAGASFNRSAHVNVLTAYGPIDLPADNATAFAWGYGVGVEIFVQQWSIVLEMSQVHTAPTFTGKGTSDRIITYKQPMNTMNLGIGLSYSF